MSVHCQIIRPASLKCKGAMSDVLADCRPSSDNLRMDDSIHILYGLIIEFIPFLHTQISPALCHVSTNWSHFTACKNGRLGLMGQTHFWAEASGSLFICLCGDFVSPHPCPVQGLVQDKMFANHTLFWWMLKFCFKYKPAETCFMTSNRLQTHVTPVVKA